MTNYEDLSLEELQGVIKNAEEALKVKQFSKRKEVLSEIKRLAESIGVTVEIHDKNENLVRTVKKVQPKYRNPDNYEQTWTGRGVMPKWIKSLVDQGRDKAEFLI